MARAPLVALLALLALLALPTPAAAQDALDVARQKYQECKTLLDAGQACDAAAACKAGLEARKNRALEKLAAEADAACAAARQAADASDPTKRKPRCKDGQELVAGHCCWPGQAWTGKACAGIPNTCPADHVADLAEQACVPGTCADGMHRADSGHCCWPEQAWSPVDLACLGEPACPDGFIRHAESGCAPDRDGDRIADAEDRCPTEPEDFDLFEDDDGCIDIDNDGDGLLDAADTCPDEAEDRDGHLDGDGCIDGDNDEDGFADAADACPDASEDLDGFADDDGCPDDDNDEDGVADATDRCPLAPEDFDGFEDQDGCAEEGSPPASPMVIAGWSSLGGGLALVGAGTALFLVADSQRDDANAALQETELHEVEGEIVVGITLADTVEIEDRTNTFDTVGVVLVSAGGAALVAGVVLLVLEATDDGLDATPAALSIAPSAGGLAVRF